MGLISRVSSRTYREIRVSRSSCGLCRLGLPLIITSEEIMEFDLHKLGLNEHDMLIDQLECRGLLTKKCGILTAFNGKQFHLEDAAGIHKTQDKEVGLQDTVDLNQFERPEAERPKNQSTDTQKCRLFNALEPIVLDRDLAAMVDDETYSADNAINVMHRQAQKNKTLESSNT